MKLKTSIAAIAVVSLFISTTACSPAVIAITLDAITIAADAALTAIGQTGGLTGTQRADIASLVQKVTGAVQDAALELQSKDSPAVKAAKVSAALLPLASAAASISGLPPTAQLAVTVLAKAIQDFVALIPTQQSLLANPGAAMKMTRAEQRKMGAVAEHARNVWLKTLPK